MTDLIFGGGIAGLIWSFYNGGKVLSDNFGGQMNNNFQLGPRYLHKNQYSKKLLCDLKIPLKSRIIKVGYYYDGQFHDNIDEENAVKYFKKSRSGSGKIEDDKTALNCKENNFEVFEVNFQTIISKLIEEVTKKNNIIQGKIERIDYKEKEVHYKFRESSHKIKYDNCISTIPLSLFLKFAKIKNREKLISMPVTYVLAKSFDLKDYDYVYFIDKNIHTPYHRVTKIQDGFVFDWIQKHSREECMELFGDNLISYKVLNNAQIINKNKDIVIKDIKFVGRYGIWDRSWKTEKVIEEAIKYAKKN